VPIKKYTYSDSGVNIEIEEQAAKILYEAAKETWSNRKDKIGEVIVPFDDFSGIRAIDISGLPKDTLLNIGFDGIGTKAEIAMLAGNYKTVGHDLMAMICDDAVVRGAEPIIAGSILDVNTLGNNKDRLKYIRELCIGYKEAAKLANIAIVNGELAQLGNHLGDPKVFSFSWGASVLWLANKKRVFTGYEIKDGDYLVGLREFGFRSNGLSLARKVLSDKYGKNWHEKKLGNEKMIDLALLPSIIYTNAVVSMFGGFDMKQKPKVSIHGVAHITGGGLPGKLARVLKPSGLGAQIDNPLDVPELMLHCQSIGNIEDKEAYRTWNMGQGMVIIGPDPTKVINIANYYGIEASVIGKITKQKSISIQSRSLQTGKNLKFN
jgi:phosphoribosylformylglycinamidine cyclo-ligase